MQGDLATLRKIYNFIINDEWKQAREPNASRWKKKGEEEGLEGKEWKKEKKKKKKDEGLEEKEWKKENKKKKEEGLGEKEEREERDVEASTFSRQLAHRWR
jgi:hypothetical protein